MERPLPYDPDQVPEGPRRALLERTPLGSSVLDVGCWSGFAGRFLAAHREAIVDGVEPVSEVAEQAAADYRTVFAQPIESALANIVSDGRRYDVVLFLDVLEHLTAPELVLAATRGLLRDGGRLLISLPNVAHWSVRKELLLGRWRYTDSGLMDRTHLRFYTRATARELLLGDGGWRIDHEDMTVDHPPLVRLPERWLPRLSAWPGLFAVQYLFEVVHVNDR